jgi:asparagine synthase (glutamine-hydrolysing)
MCGIAGFVDSRRRQNQAELDRLATAMANSLSHRGPDAQTAWTDAECGVALGHARLSIVDLSPTGAQPMHSSCERFVLAYNGEVYNALELRVELEAAGRPFRGHSDTEVIVEGFAVWGVEQTVRRLIGMFALAAWDRRERRLTLVRDRLGIKPLYWGVFDNRLIFASELKALQLVPGWKGVLDRDALAAYMRFGYVPAPGSIYQGVRKLMPGTLLEFSAGSEVRERTYWSLSDVAEAGERDPLDVSDEEAEQVLEDLLTDAVKRRLVADVPLGMFLSGGVDSSTIAALMQSVSDRPIRTFSIGFHEQSFDEAVHAKQVAAHLGTNHEEFYVTPAEAQAVIPNLPTIYDEPFADSSQIPTFLVSQMTRRHVTVALSGDGGDELFSGYNRYNTGLRLAKAIRALPKSARNGAASAIRALSPQTWDCAFALVPGRLRPRNPGDKMHKFANVLPEDGTGYYRHLISQWDGAWSIVQGAREPAHVLSDPTIKARFPDDLAWMQFLDTITYLPDDILTKVDRASMAVSLEARVPLLDHRVVELAWRLPKRFKVRDGKGKWLLRQVLYKHVPKALIERPKMGFAVPVDQWLRGPLRAWADDLLDPKGLRDAGILDLGPILQKWNEHKSGRRNWQQFLWNVLMFEAWRRQYLA